MIKLKRLKNVALGFIAFLVVFINIIIRHPLRINDFLLNIPKNKREDNMKKKPQNVNISQYSCHFLHFLVSLFYNILI